jgi:hypothetical protein
VVGAGFVMLLVLGLVLTGWMVRGRIAGLEDQVATLELERDQARAALEQSRANELVLRQGLKRQGEAIRKLQAEARAAMAAEAARQALADREGERRQLEAEVAMLREQAATASACETAWLALRAIAREGS